MTDNFVTGCATIQSLIGDDWLRQANEAALRLAQGYPSRARSHYLVNLVRTLLNINGGGKSDRMLVLASRCTDCTDAVRGDIQRDRAIGLILHRGPGRTETGVDLAMAQRLIVEAQLFHQPDSDRMALLDGVLGRWHFAQGNYRAAVLEHASADRKWQALADSGQPYTPEWRYANLMEWLRAEVAWRGRGSQFATALADRIRTEWSAGIRPRSQDAARLLRRGGLRAYRRRELGFVS
jgi:hypothetical protein